MNSHIVSSKCPTWLVVNYFVVACGGWQIRLVFPLLNSHLNVGFVLVVGIGIAGKPLAECSYQIIPYALETAYQWLKHFVYVSYGCMKWSEVDISLKHDVMMMFPSLSDPDFPNQGPTWLVSLS